MLRSCPSWGSFPHTAVAVTEFIEWEDADIGFSDKMLCHGSPNFVKGSYLIIINLIKVFKSFAEVFMVFKQSGYSYIASMVPSIFVCLL